MEKMAANKKIEMLEYSQNIGMLQIFLPVFESHCDLGRVCNGRKLSHSPLHRARIKQMLGQLGVLLFLLSRAQPEQIQVSLFVQCPSSGASGKRGDVECAAPAHALVPHWQTMRESLVWPVEQFHFAILSLESSWAHHGSGHHHFLTLFSSEAWLTVCSRITEIH